MNLANKVKLSLIIFLALTILMLVLFIYPLYKNIQDNTVELSRQKQDSLYLDDKLKNIDEFKKDYKEIRKNINKGESLLVRSEAPVSFIGFLEQISEESDISIKISPSPAIKKLGDAWYSMVFQISTTADFGNFLKFIEKIELGPYLTQIENLNIGLTDEDLNADSVGHIKSNFSLKAFANQMFK
jgi:hypothetical protein